MKRETVGEKTVLEKKAVKGGKGTVDGWGRLFYKLYKKKKKIFTIF
jgi:hypothetical protein